MKRLLILVLALTTLGGVTYAYLAQRQVTGPLTGLPVSVDASDRRPVAVMIDNLSPDARPQSGLDRASLVLEALTEGGITRFMAVYLENDAPVVGPVRSTRIYFNAWAAGLGVIFGHDGGNVDALQELPGLNGIYNEDAARIPGPYTRSSARVAPHNEYTSTSRLRSFAASHGGVVTASGLSLPHKDDAPASQRPGPLDIHVQFSYGDYNVDWRYDPRTNTYLRSVGGSPHVEATTGKQLSAKNVVVMFTTETSDPDPYTPESIKLGTEGSNQAIVYEDGRAIKGTWNKPTVTSPLQWRDESGKPISLNKGNTWVEVVPIGNGVSVSP